MMRMTSTLVFVCAAVVGACSFGEGSGQEPSGPDAAVSQNVCGDGVCASAEIGFCTQDCGMGSGSGSGGGTCGNFVCDAGETAQSCPGDCGGGGSGGGSGGGGACPSDPLECLPCFIDPSLCPPGLDETTCISCFAGGGGGGGGSGFGNCTGGFPDGTCDANENSTDCPLDCP